MATLALCCGRAAVAAGSRLVGVNLRAGEERDVGKIFVYDCSTAEKKLPESKEEDGQAVVTGSDKILASAFSPSGSYFTLTDDYKRLILFQTDPVWQCLSVRSVVRRCTALAITAAEDRIIVADKSGDVYSFSTTDPQGEGHLELGHLSMLLHLALSPDDQYIITADRDEKIRVSLLAAPHNIMAFCLGHTEFVTQLLVLPCAPDLLVSTSGDQTLRLWEYKAGREVQSCDLSNSRPQADGREEKRFAVSRMVSSGNHVAVLFDWYRDQDDASRMALAAWVNVPQFDRPVPTVNVFQFDATSRLLLHQQELYLEHGVWDIAFDASSGLWILQEDKEEVILLYRLMEGTWQRSSDTGGMKRLSNQLRDTWALMEECHVAESSFRILYKASYDNMATYLRKKEERILEQKQKKRKGAQQKADQETKAVRPVSPSS